MSRPARSPASRAPVRSPMRRSPPRRAPRLALGDRRARRSAHALLDSSPLRHGVGPGQGQRAEIGLERGVEPVAVVLGLPGAALHAAGRAKPGIGSWVIARTSKNDCSGSTQVGNCVASLRPSVCSIVTGQPTTFSRGCSTMKPVRQVTKSSPGVACAVERDAVAADPRCGPAIPALAVAGRGAAADEATREAVRLAGRSRGPELPAPRSPSCGRGSGNRSADHLHALQADAAQGAVDEQRGQRSGVQRQLLGTGSSVP